MQLRNEREIGFMSPACVDSQLCRIGKGAGVFVSWLARRPGKAGKSGVRVLACGREFRRFDASSDTSVIALWSSKLTSVRKLYFNCLKWWKQIHYRQTQHDKMLQQLFTSKRMQGV